MQSHCNPNVTIQGYAKNAFHPLRVESVTEQLRQVSYSGCRSVLEIGVAGSFMRHCLKLYPQISYTSLDVAEELKPDYVGSVTQMPFTDNQFDMVLCSQVLEHLPFAELPQALAEIRRVTRARAIISLPDKRRHFGVAICIARWGWHTVEWNPARRKNRVRPFTFNGEHYWEIGCKGSTGRKLVKTIRETGFAIEKQYRLPKHPYHCFFLLQANKGL